MNERLKVLFVTMHWPLAQAYGAQQRVLNISRLLSRFGDVSFVIVSPKAPDEHTVRRTKQDFEVLRIVRPLAAAPDTTLRRVQHRLRHEFDAGYLGMDPVAVSEEDRSALLELMHEHHVTWVHSVQIADWFRIGRWPGSVLDVDDVPSRVYWSTVQAGDGGVRRVLDVRMSWIWRRRERLLTDRFDVVTVCSEDDRQYLGSQSNVHVIPNGFHPQVMRRCSSPELPRIGFLGTLNWMPNEEGVKWFIRDVWPIIKREFPRAQLRLVGRDSDGYLSRLGPDIAGLGWLQDPGDEMTTWAAMIVPNKIGGGTRVKVAEGLARRCPIVATTIGAFGYELRNGEEILLADDAADFASACITLLGNPELGEALSERGHQRFLQRWTWDSFESTVGTVIQECLARSHTLETGQAAAAKALRRSWIQGGHAQ
jgi:glycosyltransferase involved in cell wall biosynthesis